MRGQHIPVLLPESIAALDIKPHGTYLDGTFGRGGHAAAIWQKLSPQGVLVVCDRDPAAVAAAQQMRLSQRYPARLEVVHGVFSAMRGKLLELGIDALDGVLLDLGLSSPQIDEAERGFSFRYDAPLDMRMDNSQGLTAAQWLAITDESTIGKVIYDFSEERNARAIAKKIVDARAVKPVSTTRELAQSVRAATPAGPRQQDSTARTFQAIRIALNQELTELESGLKAAQALLKPGGRLVVISFHSLEDRIVKRFLQGHSDDDGSVRLRRHLPPQPGSWGALSRMFPGEAERLANPRSHSAVLRAASRLGDTLPVTAWGVERFRG